MNNINRCTKKDKILNNTLKKCEDKDIFKLYGELLTANIYALKKRTFSYRTCKLL